MKNSHVIAIMLFVVEIMDTDRIRIERFMGKTADEVDGFGTNARIYVR